MRISGRLSCKTCFRSESLSRLQSMIALASSEPEIPVLREQMNRDPWLLTVENGTRTLGPESCENIGEGLHHKVRSHSI